MVSLLFSSMARSSLAFFFNGSLKLFLTPAEDFFRFSRVSSIGKLEDSSSFEPLGGLRTAKMKFLEFLAPDPAFGAEALFVISANFSRVEESRDRNEPRLLPVWKLNEGLSEVRTRGLLIKKDEQKPCPSHLNALKVP